MSDQLLDQILRVYLRTLPDCGALGVAVGLEALYQDYRQFCYLHEFLERRPRAEWFALMENREDTGGFVLLAIIKGKAHAPNQDGKYLKGEW